MPLSLMLPFRRAFLPVKWFAKSLLTLCPVSSIVDCQYVKEVWLYLSQVPFSATYVEMSGVWIIAVCLQDMLYKIGYVLELSFGRRCRCKTNVKECRRLYEQVTFHHILRYLQMMSAGRTSREAEQPTCNLDYKFGSIVRTCWHVLDLP